MAKRNENGLKKEWQIFADAYLVSLNATEAYKAAYPEAEQTTAGANGHRLLKNAEIAQYIAKAMGERSERLKIDADYVLKSLIDIREMDIADILDDDGVVKPIKQWPKVWRTCISAMDVSEVAQAAEGGEKAIAVLKKIKWPETLKTLELIGRHIDVQAFKDKIEATGKDGAPLVPVLNVTIGKD